MCKIALVSLLLLFCGCSMVVKPVYIGPEEDLATKIEKGKKDLKIHPTREGVDSLLSSSLTYYDRMNYKVKENNKRAVG